MSRTGKRPIALPKGVTVALDGGQVTVKGPKATLIRSFPTDSGIDVALEDGTVVVTRPSDSKEHKMMHGTVRAVIANMVQGVSDGFRKELIIEGTGYRAEAQGTGLVLNLGFSHPVNVPAPTGITFEVPRTNKAIVITGADKEVVGEVAAKIRDLRPPEPYKGKGIRYSTETIRRKAGKAGKK